MVKRTELVFGVLVFFNLNCTDLGDTSTVTTNDILSAHWGTKVFVEGGSFIAGTTPVTISSFNIDSWEVTYDQWECVTDWGRMNGYRDLPLGRAGETGYQSWGPPTYAVTGADWYDTVCWCNARSEKEGLTPAYCWDASMKKVIRSWGCFAPTVNWQGNGYRLPTEAEWEFAARGGTKSQGYIYKWQQ